MIPLSQLRVIVEETGKGQFSWAVLERKEACIADNCVARSGEEFVEFDGALEAGFAALKALARDTELPMPSPDIYRLR